MVSWDDNVLSFQLTLALVVCVIVLFLFGELLALFPWGLIWEITFRIAGAAALGPHMIYVGRNFRAEQQEYARRQAEYREGNAATRKAIIDEFRKVEEHATLTTA